MAQTSEGAAKAAAKNAGLSLDEFLARRAAGLKRCTCCKEWRPVAMFDTDRSRSDGLAAAGRCCRRVKVRVSTKGRISTFKGRTHTAEARATMSAQRKGRPGPNRGGTVPPEVRRKISEAVRRNGVRGPAHHAYKGGAKQRNLDLRRKPEYTEWRTAVFARDRYTCRDCGDKTGGNLRAHHDKPMADFPELAYDVGNGVTLCHPCHELRHYKPDSIRNERKRKRGERLWK